MKVITTFIFCCDLITCRKSKFMALKKPGRLREFFYPALWLPCYIILIVVLALHFPA